MLENEIAALNQLAERKRRPFKLLIVDDELWVRETFAEFCKLTEALEVETAIDGVEAVKKIEKNSFDLITVDLIMPELSGLDVLMEVKKVSPETPVMIITGNATDRLVHEAGLMGASGVLYKPVELPLFLTELTTVLANKRESTESRKS
ncbi:MAG: response regulator [bacterium]|nr:response regulator [bacterium]